jgi:hypothetical protein
VFFFAVMKYILLAAMVISFASCKKEKEENTTVSHPLMTYQDLTGKVINISTPAGVDITGDGTSDLWFDIFSTREDAQNKDIHRFSVSTGEQGKILVNTQNASPIITEGTTLKLNGIDGYHWKAPASTELAKRTFIRNTPAPVWEGQWKDVQNRYLAVQVTMNGEIYNGWIELSFDTAKERVILFRSAISKEPGKDIIVGL